MKKTDNQALVIFGASGDLTERKLIPAVFNLFCGGFLPESYAVIGVSRSEFTDEEYRIKVVFNNEHLKGKSTATEENLERFAKLVFYQAVDTKNIETYGQLKNRLEQLDQEITTKNNYIFYLATPPSLYQTIANGLAENGLNGNTDGWSRLIVEKPFGYDLESAKALNKGLLCSFSEEQIYRIDHYLGKETVQNMFVTRFANSIFEPLWNRNYIHRIEITAAEHVGVEKRGGYYDSSGALRDMIQNHLFQLVALVAMEPPVRPDAESIRNEKLKVFQSLRAYTDQDIKENVIRGQYLNSTVRGEAVKGYREEEGVQDQSKTETYVAMKFFIDNWRWADVPFYIRTGKSMPTRVTEVVIHFKPNHHHLFAHDSSLSNQQNVLVIRIQPNEGILLKFDMKIPGAGFNTEQVNMDFKYDELSNVYVPDAYERLILDCMQGDATLYARGDSTEAAWEFIDPILKAWENDESIPVYGYPAGTWGPENADNLIDGENMNWRYPCSNLTDDGNYCEL
ncbi:glucose-6-phosphate dehydrogenase [Roseivirga misakiensis]|uniref:Glucose-6-phosphate 1-dehydrogenase n=1 Tax=Roseivirga misakiensis TaxID=1563681 RepID=A0A1E5T010_9BACT|nr:glucose-6-phosphate dehydrogenase [Roseivirga misakiensis]OEK04710.1 glucose-6-phosphate dehydrogenase [Roseivirga misakiensis]